MSLFYDKAYNACSMDAESFIYPKDFSKRGAGRQWAQRAASVRAEPPKLQAGDRYWQSGQQA